MSTVETDLRAMHRLAAGTDGLRRLLAWLEHRFAARVALLDGQGKPVSTASDEPLVIPRDAVNRLAEVRAGRAGIAQISADGHETRLISLGATPGTPILFVSRPHRDDTCQELVNDAAPLLLMRWSLDSAQQHQQRLRHAETLVRESVLHLLLAGEVGVARRVGGTLRPPLPTVARVYIVEGAAAKREEIAAVCEADNRLSAWVIRCPVYRRHLILIAPADEPGDCPDAVEPAILAARSDVVVGAGDSVRLNELGAGYEQAFHALTLARMRPERYVRFTRESDLASHLRPDGLSWARRQLGPLLAYRPSRPQDPDAKELLGTLRSWLDFRTAAARQLKVHRNTLNARLHHIGELLGRDLDSIDVQAELHLALNLMVGAPPVGQPTGKTEHLEQLLDSPAVLNWSRKLLGTLRDPDNASLYATVCCWLRMDAQLAQTSAVLGISVAGVRKRLLRAEQVVGRSLLGAPSARYELFFAVSLRENVVRHAEAATRLIG